MIESGSSIQCFMYCPKKYDYSYNKKLESLHYPHALGLGSMVHAFVEGKTGKGRSLQASKEHSEYIAKYKNEEDQSQIHADFLLASEIVELWQQRWSKEHPFSNAEFDFIKSELEWKYRLPNAVGDTEIFEHVGKSDGVLLYKKYGKIFLYELKTAADRNRETYIHHLEIDKQISSNIIALRLSGIDIAGVVYDVIWKPSIVRKRNRKTMPDETIEEFSKRIAETMKENQEEYFARYLVYRNDKDIEEYSNDLRAQFEAMKTAKDKNSYYRNSGACDDFGRLCQYFSPCMEGKEELLQMFNTRNRKLPELTKETQDGN